MGFYDTLKEYGMTELLSRIEFKAPDFRNQDKVYSIIKDAILQKKRIFIIGDYDVDGLMCIKILQKGLEYLGAQNVDVFKYRSRTHVLDPVAVQECIQGGYDCCIIADCGSNSRSLLRRLLNYGIQVILLDHHETMMGYDEYEQLGNIAVINAMLEEEDYSLSAAALCYCVMSKMCADECVYEKGLSVYAIISLYADCMNMHHPLNRAIYYRAVAVAQSDIPKDVAMFMNSYQVISSRFINFWFSPRINAMFRSENLRVLNKLFLSKDVSTVEIAECLEEVEVKYQEIRNLILKVADIIQVTEMETFVVADVRSVDEVIDVDENRLWNYTGLIANTLADNYSKAAFIYCEHGGNIKGSVRDIFGRDFLSPFSQLCKADGHNPAFGVYIRLLDLEDFLINLNRLDKKITFSVVSNKPIVLNYVYQEADKNLIEDVAQINEFASVGVPVILLRKQRVGAMREIKTEYSYKYGWGDYWIQSQHAQGFGSWMLLRPTKAIKTKLIVQ